MASTQMSSFQGAGLAKSLLKRHPAGASPWALLLSLVLAPVVQAGPPVSADYSIITNSIDAAGGRTCSADYSNDSSAGEIVGASSVAGSAEMVRNGYLGRLYEVSGLQFFASSATLSSAQPLQLGAGYVLDDATILSVPADKVAWSIPQRASCQHHPVLSLHC
jgi:hypothetical protein